MKEEILDDSKFQIVLQANNRLLNLQLKEVWKYRDFIWLYTKRSFQISYKQTILGPLWLFLNPLINAMVFAFVFGEVVGVSTGGVPQTLFYLGGNAVWGFFSSVLSSTASTFRANAGIFGKIYFPRLTIPIANMLSSFIRFMIKMSMFFLFWSYYIICGTVKPNYSYIPLFFLALLQMGCLALGVGIIISSITTKYRDLMIVFSFIIQLWMYITPVVYPLSILSEGWKKTLIFVNPVTCGVEMFRYAFFGTGMLSPFWWSVTISITIVALLIGIIMFSHVEKTFMDTV